MEIVHLKFTEDKRTITTKSVKCFLLILHKNNNFSIIIRLQFYMREKLDEHAKKKFL